MTVISLLGWKFSEYEMRGVPIRIEMGPKDIENNQVVLVNRVNREKTFVSLDNVETELQNLLDKIQQQMFDAALKIEKKAKRVLLLLMMSLKIL